MGGIQARAGSVAEVHAVRGGQLILRVSQSQTTREIKAKKAKRQNSFKGLMSLGIMGSSFEEIDKVERKPMKAYHGHCYLLDQSMDILEKIFLWLSPRDLALLCLTSKNLYRLVTQFLEHRISCQGLPEKIAQFFTSNEFLLLPKEIILRDRIKENDRPQLLLYSSMKQFLGTVRRVSLAEEFIRQNPSAEATRDIVRERDVSLKRDIVVVKRTCQSLKFFHTFKNVPPGKYTVQLRIKLTGPPAASSQSLSSTYQLRQAAAAKNSTGRIKISRSYRVCQYHSSNSTLSSVVSDQIFSSDDSNNNIERLDSKYINVCFDKNETCSESRTSTPPPSPIGQFEVEELMTQSIDANWWFKIVEHAEYSSSLSHAEIIYDRDSDWFFLRMNDFDIDKESDIEFDFQDTVDDETDILSTIWRHTMIWDFIELRQIVKCR